MDRVSIATEDELLKIIQEELAAPPDEDGFVPQGITAPEARQKLNLSHRRVNALLDNMVEKGILYRDFVLRKDKWGRIAGRPGYRATNG